MQEIEYFDWATAEERMAEGLSVARKGWKDKSQFFETFTPSIEDTAPLETDTEWLDLVTDKEKDESLFDTAQEDWYVYVENRDYNQLEHLKYKLLEIEQDREDLTSYDDDFLDGLRKDIGKMIRKEAGV